MDEHLFFYQDFFMGKVLKVKYGEHAGKFAFSKFEYNDQLIDKVNKIVRSAESGSFISSVDVLLVMARFLENCWPIPESLSTYTAKILNDVVVNFGEAEGGADSRNAAIAKSLGLVVPRGRAKKGAALKKKMLVYSYMHWRMLLYGENLYNSAMHADMAFKGTPGLSHDYCEKIYNELVKEKNNYPYNLFDFDIKYLFYQKQNPLFIKPVVFDDDKFLNDMIPYAKDEQTRERWVMLLSTDEQTRDEWLSLLSNPG